MSSIQVPCTGSPRPIHVSNVGIPSCGRSTTVEHRSLVEDMEALWLAGITTESRDHTEEPRITREPKRLDLGSQARFGPGVANAFEPPVRTLMPKKDQWHSAIRMAGVSKFEPSALLHRFRMPVKAMGNIL
ncbi:hypothetical protein [Streptomyces sp. NPDC060187]|uniref:hypothetical protein n=1 Tax=Streptomyces sp. NPDC060187 TaxID=3347067 RepID=UPI0036562A31